MPITLRQNPYRGINAHLQSLLQNAESGWPEFHNLHITHIAEFIDRLLPDRYIIRPQKSFQITALAAERLVEYRRKVIPDVTVTGRKPTTQSTALSSSQETAPTLTLSTTEAFDDPEDYFSAVTIQETSDVGKTVAWIELISPTNKPPHTGYVQYNEKRLMALQGGIVLVEMDYLHQTNPIIHRLGRYPVSRAYPYYITLTDPKPRYTDSQVHVYGFVVDEPIPTIRIPLLDDDTVTVDFGAIYRHSFESLRIFSAQIDYEHEPPQIETYSQEDQKRIRERMANVQQSQSSDET